MVKQVRVLKNVFIIAAVFLGFLCGLKNNIYNNLNVAFYGGFIGVLYGWFYWRLLSKRICRKAHRFERNKIFVRFLCFFEMIATAAAISHYILFGIAIVFIVIIIFGFSYAPWLAIFVSTFAFTASFLLGAMVLRFEYNHGPLYYQYDSRSWLGREGMLYREGVVVEPLDPAGKVTVGGELWNANSKSGGFIEKGEKIEVISMDGLTLYVARLSQDRDIEKKLCY